MRMILSLLLFGCLMVSERSHAFTKGFNQGWFKYHYSTQWLNGFYDHNNVEKALRLNQQAGSKIFRIWLFEGVKLKQFDLDKHGYPVRLKPGFLRHLRDFLLLARKYETKINITLFDGNAYEGMNKLKNYSFWWNVFNDRHGAQEAIYSAGVSPVYRMIAAEFKDVVTQIDLVNEVNALLEVYAFENREPGMARFLCNMKKESPAPVTASLGWGDAVENYFNETVSNSCLDFYDVHLYNDEGSIPRCSDFLSHARKGIKLQLGEFGIEGNLDDARQATATQRFLTNAQQCGFQSALAWRLEDIHRSPTEPQKYGYIVHGKPRPVYEAFSSQQ